MQTDKDLDFRTRLWSYFGLTFLWSFRFWGTEELTT